MKYRFLIILPFLAGVLVFIPYFINHETTLQLSDYPPQIFVNDSIYVGTGKVISAIPTDADYIGSIIEVVPQHEPMVHENFYSNLLPIGTEIYSFVGDQSVVYAKIETSSSELYSEYKQCEATE